MHFDFDIIRKYDKPGPRYTSYPTAPHFHEGFTHEQYRKEIIRTNGSGVTSDISLYFHIPYCDTLCYFCGCNMLVTRDRKRISKYRRALLTEIEMMKSLIAPGRKVSQLHWGGGTPTHLDPAEISELASAITSAFGFTPDSENSCEIDPRGLSKEHLIALRSSGFNRISMGVQDFDEQVQKAVNRFQPESLTRSVVDWVRELGFHSINLDLMYGLPFQSLEKFKKTLDSIVDISPDRIAVFNYAHLPWFKKHMALIKEEDLPKPEEKLAILKLTIETLTNAGYEFIGMDHFAKPNDELAIALREKKLYRNFQGYSTRAGADLYALGVTSISSIGTVYAQNYKTEAEYIKAVEAGNLPVFKGYSLTEDDLLRQHVIMKIMCDFELSFAPVEARFNIRFKEYFAAGLQGLAEMEKDGLVTLTESGFFVNERGRLLIRNIAMNFDGYIERSQDEGKYSRTV